MILDPPAGRAKNSRPDDVSLVAKGPFMGFLGGGSPMDQKTTRLYHGGLSVGGWGLPGKPSGPHEETGMELRDLGPAGQAALEQVLGYLNFSSGATDPQFLANLNQLYLSLEGSEVSDPRASDHPATWRDVGRLLREGLSQLASQSTAFQDPQQAAQVLDLLLDHLLPEYLEFHRDLLFHQTEATLFRPFFVGRAAEAILQQGSPWDETERITQAAIRSLNDYVGHRPVAILESRALEPYPHEKLRPIPLFIEGAGVAVGPYHTVVEQALEMLRQADPAILRAACFHPDHLRELAVDPRAYDFDHPVNKRPNYHFGQWDPHAIDARGFYHRFVVQQVTLDALMSRLEAAKGPVAKQRIREAAAVLSGTILMASGISGAAPDAHDSETTLSKLLPGVAAYRDAFYEQLMERLAEEDPRHAARLRSEAKHLRQPFGGARQHLNAQLTDCRASQLEHVRLATLFARMGYPEAAHRQLNSVPVASARMLCQIDCNLTLAQQATARQDLQQADQHLREVREVLQRAIECGAVIDPWNILGFDGNFSLFPAMENSIHDHRVDEMIEVVDEVIDTYSRLWSAAAAADDAQICRDVALQLEDFTKWWHQFAVHEVSCVDCADPLELFRSAENVAEALNHWHKAGEARGDIGFWAPYAEKFTSPKAYGQVIERLLERHDVVAARALLIHWLGQAENIPLEQADESFYRLALCWLCQVLKLTDESSLSATEGRTPATADDWRRTQKFFDYLEANAGIYWEVPQFRLSPSNGSEEPPDDDDFELGEAEEEPTVDDLYEAAYEDVVYRDSTDDGVEGAIHDTGGPHDDQLDVTHDQIVNRLAFLNSLARLRRLATLAWLTRAEATDEPTEFRDALDHWLRHSTEIRSQLERLLLEVGRHRLATPNYDYLSRAEFDRERMIKESLMEHVIAASVETALTGHVIICALESPPTDLPADESQAVALLRAAIRGQQREVKSAWRELTAALRRQPILYVPLVRGGNPKQIVAVRIRQQMLRVLLAWLPRLGLLAETRELIEVIRVMERSVPSGQGAVTEFDDLFEVGFRALIDCIIRATNVDESQDLAPSGMSPDSDPELVSCLESMTESMLVTWLAHSRTLRLSVLEKVKSREAWQQLIRFIKRHGDGLFTQQFLSLANVRSILFQGVDEWLQDLMEESPADFHPSLLDELNNRQSFEQAVAQLTLVLEAVVENYSEYRDYNSTTTQSDRGDLLYNLLDFLRLLSDYERVVWNLKPVAIVHEMLVRRGRNDAAEQWRLALTERISDEADRYIERLSRLQKRYAMRLSTVADRIHERFLRPLVIDRMRALVEPATRHHSLEAFAILEHETSQLMQKPSGVGFDPPAWLLALDEELRRVRAGTRQPDEQRLFEALLPTVELTIEDVQRQIEKWNLPSQE